MCVLDHFALAGTDERISRAGQIRFAVSGFGSGACAVPRRVHLNVLLVGAGKNRTYAKTFHELNQKL